MYTFSALHSAGGRKSSLPMLYQQRQRMLCEPKVIKLQRQGKLLFSQLNPENNLEPLVSVKARSYHRHYLHVADGKANIEPLPSSLPDDIPANFGHSESMTVPYNATNLHAPPYHFERVGQSLGHKTSHRTST